MIEIELLGKKWKNPTVLASGVLSTTLESLERIAEEGAGAVTTKSLTLEPRSGHPGPNIIEVECGLLNAMGYPNPGIEEGIKEFSNWKREEPLILSITGKNVEEFGLLAEKIEQTRFAPSAIEAAISCPHTPGYGLMADQTGPDFVEKVVNKIKEKTKIPLIIKLSPSAPGEVAAAKAAERAGADAINMGNTIGPGMKIDIERKKPILGFGRGGLSGPAIKPITMRCVYDIYEAVGIPIIATGGVVSGEDAIEYIMAGATAIGVGSGIYYRTTKVFKKISLEMKRWLHDHGYKKIEEIKGIAHER
ncbi:MAG: dihydroorotate dehydrogenase [Candidatus Bilamarchaeaceae archaeon]